MQDPMLFLDAIFMKSDTRSNQVLVYIYTSSLLLLITTFMEASIPPVVLLTLRCMIFFLRSFAQPWQRSSRMGASVWTAHLRHPRTGRSLTQPCIVPSFDVVEQCSATLLSLKQHGQLDSQRFRCDLDSCLLFCISDLNDVLCPGTHHLLPLREQGLLRNGGYLSFNNSVWAVAKGFTAINRDVNRNLHVHEPHSKPLRVYISHNYRAESKETISQISK